MPDTKQLIVSFLILSLVVSSGVFVTSLFVSHGNQQSNAASKQEQVGAQGHQQDMASYTATPQQQTYTKNTNNVPGTAKANLAGNSAQTLTEQFADTVAAHIVQNNPNGPRTADGTSFVQVPSDTDELIADFLASKNISLSESSFAVDVSRINEVSDSRTALEAYTADLDRITQKFGTARQQQVLNRAPTRQTVRAVRLMVDEARLSLYEVDVPKSMMEFHVAFLHSFEAQSAWLKEFESDPLRGTAVAPQAIQVAERAMQEAQQILLDAQNNPQTTYLPDAPFGIAVAHAITVADVLNFTTHLFGYFLKIQEWYQTVKEWYDKYAKEYLKNTYINAMVNAIIKYAVLGQDSPRIVTNWENYLQGTANAAAGAFIEEIAPQLCNSFGPVLSVQLQQPYLAPPTSTCTLTQVIDNIENFQRSFESGGFVAYSFALMPSNNYFGSLWQTTQRVEARAEAAKEAAEAEAIAGAGNLGTKQCDDGSEPNGSGQCADGSEPTITTPGRNLSDLLSKGLGSAIDRIVNAETFDALAAFAIDMAAGKLFDSGNDGLLRGNIATRDSAGAGALCQSYEPGTQAHQDCIDSVEDPEFVRDPSLDPTVPTESPDNPYTCVANAYENEEAAEEAISVNLLSNNPYVVPPDKNEDGSLTPRDRQFLIIPGEEEGHYTRATLQFDFFLSEFNVEAPSFSHPLFELRNAGGSRETPDPHFSSSLGLTEGDINRGYLDNASGGFRWGTGQNNLAQESVNWKENTWYTFRVVYDAAEGRYFVEARERDTGQKVATVVNKADYSIYSQGGGFVLILHGRNIKGDIPGSDGEGVHHMEDAEYRNLRLTLEPGEPVCTNAATPNPVPPGGGIPNIPGAGGGSGSLPGGGSSGGGDEPTEPTAPPTVQAGDVELRRTGEKTGVAILTATIDPNGQAEYWFNLDRCTAVVCGSFDVDDDDRVSPVETIGGDGEKQVEFRAEIDFPHPEAGGLNDAFEYTWHIVAENEKGKTTGGDQKFKSRSEH